LFFFEIVSNGQLPYSDLSNVEVVLRVCEGGYPKKPSSADSDIYDLAQSIANLDPEKRLTLDEIIAKIENIEIENEDPKGALFTNYYKSNYYLKTIQDSKKKIKDENENAKKNEPDQSDAYVKTPIEKKVSSNKNEHSEKETEKKEETKKSEPEREESKKNESEPRYIKMRLENSSSEE